MRRRIAFNMNFQAEFRCGLFRRIQEFQIVINPLDRRHENAQPDIARFNGYGRAHRTINANQILLDAVLHRTTGSEMPNSAST